MILLAGNRVGPAGQVVVPDRMKAVVPDRMMAVVPDRMKAVVPDRPVAGSVVAGLTVAHRSSRRTACPCLWGCHIVGKNDWGSCCSSISSGLDGMVFGFACYAGCRSCFVNGVSLLSIWLFDLIHQLLSGMQTLCGTLAPLSSRQI